MFTGWRLHLFKEAVLDLREEQKEQRRDFLQTDQELEFWHQMSRIEPCRSLPDGPSGPWTCWLSFRGTQADCVSVDKQLSSSERTMNRSMCVTSRPASPTPVSRPVCPVRKVSTVWWTEQWSCQRCPCPIPQNVWGSTLGSLTTGGRRN